MLNQEYEPEPPPRRTYLVYIACTRQRDGPERLTSNVSVSPPKQPPTPPPPPPTTPETGPPAGTWGAFFGALPLFGDNLSWNDNVEQRETPAYPASESPPTKPQPSRCSPTVRQANRGKTYGKRPACPASNKILTIASPVATGSAAKPLPYSTIASANDPGPFAPAPPMAGPRQTPDQPITVGWVKKSANQASPRRYDLFPWIDHA